jgi:type IX secretion system PorP/SprF family membrane protein
MSLFKKKLFNLYLMKKIYLIILLSGITIEIFSQQDPQFFHNADNLLFTNPAYAGMTEGICASAISRQQWVGFVGAPVTTLAGIHSKLKLFNIPGGVGLSIMDDRFEFEKNFQIKAAYSYHRRVLGGLMGFGIEAGMINKDLKGDWKYPDTSDDPFIPKGEVQRIKFDLGAGVFYKTGAGFYAGVSVSHIHNPRIDYTGVDSASFLRRHYFATTGYNFRLFNTPFEIQPSVFVKSDGTKIQYDVNLSALYNKKVRAGVSFRNRDAIVPGITVEIGGGLRVGYAYELSLNKLITVSKGTHEVYVGYCFDFWGKSKNFRYRSILYL